MKLQNELDLGKEGPPDGRIMKQYSGSRKEAVRLTSLTPKIKLPTSEHCENPWSPLRFPWQSQGKYFLSRGTNFTIFS